VGVPAFLGLGTPQHAGDRERRNVGRHRAYRRRITHDPHRRQRDHVAESPPIVIAEQFGTLARLFPGRIDLVETAARF